MKATITLSVEVRDRNGEPVELSQEELDAVASQISTALPRNRFDRNDFPSAIYLEDVKAEARKKFEPKIEILTRVPREGERVRVKANDIADAGNKIVVGEVGTVTVVTPVKIGENGETDFTIEVNFDHGEDENNEGGWGIFAEDGKYYSDFFDGKTALDAFWLYFEVIE